MRISSSRLTVGFSNIGHMYTHLFMLLYPTVVLALEGEFSKPYGELLSFSLLGFILFGAGAVPAGWLGDRWSAKGMMAVFFLGLGSGAVLTGLARSPLQIGAGLAVIGLFASVYHPVGIALLVSHAKSRGTALGINGVFGNLGTAAAALVAGALTDLISWRAAFIVPGMVAIATGLVFVMVAPGGRVAEAAPEARGKAPPQFSRRVIFRAMAVLSITLLCGGLIYQVTSVALPKVFAQRITDFSVGGALSVGGWVTAVYLFSSGAQLLGGYLADRLPLKGVYVLAYTFQLPIFLFAAIASGYPLLVASAVLVSLNVGAAPAESSLIAHYSPAKWRATAFGAKFAVALGVSALGIPLVALIHSTTGGFFWLYVTLAGLAGILAVAGLFLPPGERRKVAASTPAAGTLPTLSEGD
jgi:MFS family permease